MWALTFAGVRKVSLSSVLRIVLLGHSIEIAFREGEEFAFAQDSPINAGWHCRIKMR
jgi:hypothetical protein